MTSKSKWRISNVEGDTAAFCGNKNSFLKDDEMCEEVTTFASDFGSQSLVTDLVHELSSGLEIPFLLSGSSYSDFDKKEKCNELLFDKEKCDFKYNDAFYEKEENDLWMDQDVLGKSNSVKREMEVGSEVEDLQAYLDKNDVFTTYLKTDSSGHGSGSDTSSTELWTVKSERDASPVTPSEERISPDNVIFFSNNELQFIPISQQGSRKNKQAFNSNGSRSIRIQPKPNTTFVSRDDQQFSDKPEVCTVFKDIRSSLLGSRNGLNGMVRDVKNTVLCRKDSEILQAKRKQERMIRNRESAYLSRKRKKEYVANLEKQVQDLVNENNQLKQENHSLKERLMKYEDVVPFANDKKSRNIFIDSPRRTTALFALMLTVCLNIGSFRSGGEAGDISLQNNKVPFLVPNARHSRSLLWTDPQLEDLKSLANFSKTSCPVNQTESIRLESELRRWIGGDDDFSRPIKRNISNIDQYFFSPEKTNKTQSRSKRKNRVRKMHSPSGIEMDVFPMKSHFFNFDTFFEAINRRDDTFYLVSFSADHLLLPALAHNKTSRPKMSLMLPAFLSNSTMGVSSDQVEMMQIDCEVTNTQLLSVNENDIPSHMRPYSNSTSRQRSSGAEDATQFSQFLYDNMNEKKTPNESINDSMTREMKNYSLSRINDPLNSGNMQEDIVKGGRGKGRVPFGIHLNQMTKEKNEKFKTDNSHQEDFFSEKPSRETNGSNNDGEDGVHFLYPNGKGFLKSLMDAPSLSQKKNFEFSRKPYVKTVKSTMKFLFP